MNEIDIRMLVAAVERVAVAIEESNAIAREALDYAPVAGKPKFGPHTPPPDIREYPVFSEFSETDPPS